MIIKEKWNVIIVDWTNLAHTAYKTAITHAKRVAKLLKNFTASLTKVKAVFYSSIHYVGYSLGAQVCGMAGYELKKDLNVTIARITGLDPARPLFEWPEEAPDEEMLDKNDAYFVDIIHTNAGVAGVESPYGHVDFYPNGGTRQPGCESCKEIITNNI